MGNDNASFVGKGGSGATDNSWLEAIWSGDFFMGPLDRGGSVVNYISYAEEAGFVGFHGHPLNGTKFFTWGQSGPGRFMQVRRRSPSPSLSLPHPFKPMGRRPFKQHTHHS
jgi:hypothetical protein